MREFEQPQPSGAHRLVQPEIKKARDAAYPLLLDASFNADVAKLLGQLDRSTDED